MKEKMLFCCQGEQCSESCCGAFSGFSDRLFSVEGREFKDIILTPQDFNRLHESIYNKYIFIDKDGIKKIITDEQGVCSAYQSGKCLMNDFKPTICKCFPLYLDAFIGLCAFKDCPSVKKDYTVENYSNELQYLLDMYEFWVSYYRNLIDKHRRGV